MKVLSLFDGMACGMLAMKKSGVQVDQYFAYEIDKYAVKTAQHNFPTIEEKGDVFAADFTQYKGIDFLVGGSPCTYWSIAQKNNRETEASGLGWELFSQYVRALREAQPKYFIYENNKSMAKAIRDSIRETFGFEEICINSALVSAQNRQRYYWVGKRNEDGTYSKVDVQQPVDKGILLKDVLDGAVAMQDKSYAYTTRCQGAAVEDTITRHRHTMVALPVCTTVGGKSFTVTATEWKGGNVKDTLEKHRRTQICEPVRAGCMPSPDGTIKNSQGMRVYSVYGKSVNQTAQGGGLGAKTGLYAVPVETELVPFVISKLDKAVEKYGYIPKMWNPYNNAEITDKAPTQTAQCASQTKSSTVIIVQYATPCEWDSNGIPTKAISGADGKTYTVYSVQNGQITIKGKTYPIKLNDGYYIIRKLTVSECKRLQTVPEWYDFSCVSNTQAYKMLGNGWTVDVISHLIDECLIS